MSSSSSDKTFGTTQLPCQKDLRAVKLISFDFFDTLVYRKSVTHHQMWKNESEVYFRQRFKAEILARILNRIRGIPEVTGSDIYARMPKRWSLEFEIELELRNLLPNPLTVGLLKQAISDGQTACIISDTHYRGEEIGRFLEHLGIPEVRIFTSSESMLTKSTGLFGEVQKILGVAFADWAHIGDNLQSDVSSPKKLGIKSLHYPPMKNHLIDSGLISQAAHKFLRKSNGPGNESISGMFRNLLSAIDKADSHDFNMPEVLGSVVGDLVATAIAEEIHGMHVDSNYDLILYSSRDGWLPFLAHKKLFPNDPIEYFKTSRKMLEDSNFKDYLSGFIADSDKMLLFDLGWRGSTAKRISKDFPDKKWDFVYWQLLGNKTTNQFELNPGVAKNRLRIWRSRDFLESVFTDPSAGYDKIGDGLVPIERHDLFVSKFKDPILAGAKCGIEDHSAASSLKLASLTLESFCRYPSDDLLKFAEDHLHQVNEKSTGHLAITTWKDLFTSSRILWPYGSRLDSRLGINRALFAGIVLFIEFRQRTVSLLRSFLRNK